ncbi:MAG TPA: site-2 protease family protein [Pirellulales bacterium]|jgi:hypothetical protein|nr:site-2 protease family protein [Pirellulales bacterium]
MSVVCTHCRAEFPTEKGFTYRRTHSSEGVYTCPTCVARGAETRFLAWASAAFAITAIGASPRTFGLPAQGGFELLFFGAFGITWILQYFVHELAHACAAWMLGVQVFSISIGSGSRSAYEGQWFGCRVTVGTIPLGGSIICLPRTRRWARLREFLIVLAGPLSNIGCLIGAMGVASEASKESPWLYISTAVLAVNLIRLPLMLFPAKVFDDGRVSSNDGRRLLIAFRRTAEQIERSLSARYRFEATRALRCGRPEEAHRWLDLGESRYPTDSIYAIARSVLFLFEDRFQEGREAILSLMEKDSALANNGGLQNNLAWANLNLGDPLLLQEAAFLSESALRQDPHNYSCMGTRGSVLVELNEVEKAIPHLKNALWGHYFKPHKALIQCYLALAMLKLKDARQAEEYLAAARRLDPRCRLLPRVERAVASCAPSSPAATST